MSREKDQNVLVAIVKKILLGKPLASNQLENQRLKKIIALPVYASDAISSSVYATHEILLVTALFGSSLALALNALVPISVAVAVLIAIVVISYRKTIYAYPNGGGSYVVTKENLGEKASLIAGASILVDYVLSVAVAASAGVRAITSIPAFSEYSEHRIGMCVAVIAFITVINLRGIRESGTLFAIPTYAYIFGVGTLILYGIAKSYFGLFGGIEAIEFSEYALQAQSEGLMEAGGMLGIFLILRGFSSGAVALTGIEAIANGVPGFAKPAPKNAAKTMVMMGAILSLIFVGISLLAAKLHPVPLKEGESVFSQLGRTVFGESILYYVFQGVTVLVLLVAANTAFTGFPRLASTIAKDGFLPKQLANIGDKLVFSNGILSLGLLASALVVIFRGSESRLIPLYAVGAFTTFTLSQIAMVKYQLRQETPNKFGAAISGVGALTTLVVLITIAVTKFTSGAWISILVGSIFYIIFKAIKSHYSHVHRSIKIPQDYRSPRMNHTMIVLVGQIHKGTITALEYARSMAPNYLVAITVVSDEKEKQKAVEIWDQFNFDIPLEIVHSPYRELGTSVFEAIQDLDSRWDNDIITVVIPEFVVKHWWEHFLHNQSALMLKAKLLFRKNTVVVSVPYQID